MSRVVVLIDKELPEEAIADWREVARSFAAFQGEPVTVGTAGPAGVAEVGRLLEGSCVPWEFDVVQAVDDAATPKNAPMSSAEFVWREDGRPDWSAMWTNFCELALYGGPPHRGDTEALRAPTVRDDDAGSDAIKEIRRGIFETTGLFAEPAGPGWIAVTCSSPRMAAWLCATILLENVEARCEGERLLLPASPGFELKNEVKSVITVLAKTNHYWEAHIASQAAAS